MLLNTIYDEDSDHENVYYGKVTDEISELINWLHIHYLEKMTVDMITKRMHICQNWMQQEYLIWFRCTRQQ